MRVFGEHKKGVYKTALVGFQKEFFLQVTTTKWLKLSRVRHHTVLENPFSKGNIASDIQESSLLK